MYSSELTQGVVMSLEAFVFAANGPDAKQCMERIIKFAALQGGVKVMRLPKANKAVLDLVASDRELAGAERVSRIINKLLVDKKRPYREMWRAYAKQERKAEPNRHAVVRAIIAYLTSTSNNVNERSVTDKTLSALDGKAFTKDTAQLFVKAFKMSKDDQKLLDECF